MYALGYAPTMCNNMLERQIFWVKVWAPFIWGFDERSFRGFIKVYKTNIENIRIKHNETYYRHT